MTAISNTLTGMTGSIYSAVDIVSREAVGLIPAVARNGEATRAEKDKAVTVPVSRANVAADITPSMVAPNPTDRTLDTATITIDKVRKVSFGYTGEDVKGLNNGIGFVDAQTQEIAQALRTLTNEVESDIAALYTKASRAYGTAGTTPFASDLSASAGALKILIDNGAPASAGWSAGINTEVGLKLRSLGNFTKANEAGSLQYRETGTFAKMNNGIWRESAQISTHTKGDGTGFVTDLAATLAVGATTVHVDTGTEEILAGDVVTFAGDANKYIVATGHDAGAGATEGDIVLAAPGLRQTLADGVAMTIGDSYVPNMFFTPNSIQLAARLPALPSSGQDMAHERMTVVDPMSGLVFDFAHYHGYYQESFEVSMAWGVDVVKPEHFGILLG